MYNRKNEGRKKNISKRGGGDIYVRKWWKMWKIQTDMICFEVRLLHVIR